MYRISAFGLALGLLLLLLPATSWAQQRPAIAEQMAKVYGIDSFGKVEAIRYTFNFEFGDHKFSRSWVWSPKTDTVSYSGKDKAGKPVKVTYARSQLGSQSDAVQKEVDPAFWNDQYWLVFPFHVIWDTNATVTDDGMQPLPSGKGSGHRITVKYPSDGGYAPGDTWEIFLGGDNRIVELAYHGGGSTPPKLVTATWTGYMRAGPILFSTEHRGAADGTRLRIHLTGVAVKMVGSKAWIPAK